MRKLYEETTDVLAEALNSIDLAAQEELIQDYIKVLGSDHKIICIGEKCISVR